MGADRRVRHQRIIPSAVLLLTTAFLLTSYLQFLAPNVAAQPSITLQMSMSATDVEPGDMVTCRIVFNNTGMNKSSIAWINVSLPSALVYTSDTSAGEGGVKTGDYNWTFINVTVMDHSFDINLFMSSNVQDGERLNITARIEYVDELFVPMPPSNAFAMVTARRPELTVTKTAETYEISPDQKYNYTVSFQNAGSVNASLVYINDTLPWALEYDNDTASSIGGSEVSPMNWSFSNVLGSRSFDITVKALSNLTDGMLIDNNLRLFYRNAFAVWFPMEAATNTTMVVSVPSFTFTNTDSKSTASPGDLLNYTLSLSNIGTGIAKEAWIEDTIPDGTTYFDSLPACGSFVNNTCTWILLDIGLETRVVNLIVRINASAPVGAIIRNTAFLNYTDDIGNPIGSLSANDTTTVRGSYLSLVLQSRSLTSTPYDTLQTDILIRNQSPQPSLHAWLNVTLPQEMRYVSDNSSDIGGTKTGTNRWEFSNIPQGNRSFRLISEIYTETADGIQLQVGIQLDHTNATGIAFPTITDGITIAIQAPVLSPQIDTIKRDYQQSETAAVMVYLNNTGSATAFSVWVDLSVPSSVKHLNDTSDSIGGVKLSDLSFQINDLEPGLHSFVVYLDIGSIEKSADIDVWLFVNYTDSNEDLIGQTSERVSFGVIVPSEEFPVLLLSFVVLIAFVMSLGFVTRRESVKYSLLMFIVPLFSRLKKENVLDHETRGMIRGYIVANPGDHFNSIKDTLDLKNGTLAHHINILEREGIVKSVKDGKFRRFFPTGMRISENAYPTKIEKLILDIIAETPGITQKDIGTQLGMSQPTVSYHITKLRKAKRLHTEKHGMSLRHYLEDSEE
jgi:uncharacterized repeat protein (TIGR01451 family)